MRFVYFMNDMEVIANWLKDEDIYNEVIKANQKYYQTDKKSEIYILHMDDDIPVGWFILYNIEPNNRAEIGVNIIDERGKSITGKAALYFMQVAFNIYNLKEIYVSDSNENSSIPLSKVGFVDNKISRDTFELKWLKYIERG